MNRPILAVALLLTLTMLGGCGSYEPATEPRRIVRPGPYPRQEGGGSAAERGRGSGSFMVALLLLAVFVVPTGLLFRDGIFTNVIRLVNVVTAGLVAMNSTSRWPPGSPRSCPRSSSAGIT